MYFRIKGNCVLTKEYTVNINTSSFFNHLHDVAAMENFPSDTSRHNTTHSYRGDFLSIWTEIGPQRLFISFPIYIYIWSSSRFHSIYYPWHWFYLMLPARVSRYWELYIFTVICCSNASSLLIYAGLKLLCTFSFNVVYSCCVSNK